MTNWIDALREFRRRRGRTFLSLLSVAVAVAAIVAVASATATTRKAFQEVFQALSGRADLEVAAGGGGHFQQDLVEPLRGLPGVAATAKIFQRSTIVYVHGDKAKVLAIGFDPAESESLAGYRLTKGSLPIAGQVALESSLAAALRLDVGDNLRLLSSRGLRPHQISGIVTLEDAVRLHQGGMLLAPLGALQHLFKATGQIDGLHLYLSEPKRPGDVIAAATKLLPEELRVRVPSSRSGLAEETLLLTEVSLDMVTALSFTTALFIVLSVFLMSVGERRRELSILRAVGATRRQMMGLVCREALLMGLLGTLIGIPAGIFGGRLLLQSMATILQTNLPQTPNLSWALGVGAVVGPAICLLASWYPARKAAAVSPLEGMRPVVTVEPSRGHRATTVAGTLGMAITFFVAIGCLRGDLPIWSAIAGLILCLVSLVLLAPVSLAPALAVLAWPLSRLLAVEGEMSQKLVLRHAGRSSLTIGVLFIAVAAGVGTSNGVFSVTDDIRTWYERTITADFLLRAMMPDMDGQQAAGMPDELRDQVAAIEGVARVEAVRFVRVDAAGHDAILVAREFGLYERTPLDLIGDELPDTRARVGEGAAVVASALADRLKLRVGDKLHVTMGDKSHDFPVAAITTEYSFGGSVIYVDRPIAVRVFDLQGVDSFLIASRPGTAASLEPKLRALAEQNGLLLQSFSDLLRLIDSMVAGITGGLWALLALGLLVGALGVVNTLTMNVLEQVRELGMLRAIGMRRGQVIKSVLGQALYIGLFGVLAGGACGVFLARMINLCLGSMFGHYIPFALRPQFVMLLLVAALAVVMVSALVPARRAARLAPLEAMRQE